MNKKPYMPNSTILFGALMALIVVSVTACYNSPESSNKELKSNQTFEIQTQKLENNEAKEFSITDFDDVRFEKAHVSAEKESSVINKFMDKYYSECIDEKVEVELSQINMVNERRFNTIRSSAAKTCLSQVYSTLNIKPITNGPDPDTYYAFLVSRYIQKYPLGKPGPSLIKP